MPLARAAALLLSLGLSAAAADTRPLTGTATYRERIALDPGALLVVEARGPDGALAAAARVRADGRHVPLPFSLDAPAGADLTLRAALFVGGRASHASAPVTVAAGDAAATLDPVLLTRFDALAFATPFRCGDTRVNVAFAGDGATLRRGAQSWALSPEPAASGARYTAPGAALWSKGNSATVTLGGVALPECHPAIPPALVPLTARGNEPGWTLTIAERRITFAPFGGTPLDAPLPAADPLPGALRFAMPGGPTVTLTDAIHRDTMTGMPRPVTVTVTVAQGDSTLTGGGGDPLTLLTGPEWRAVALDGAPLPDGAAVTLTVLPGGRLAGTSACNRYAGTLRVTGEGLSPGPLAGTRMACPEPLMTVEARWLDRLAATTRFDIARDGALILYAGDTATARLVR